MWLRFATLPRLRWWKGFTTEDLKPGLTQYNTFDVRQTLFCKHHHKTYELCIKVLADQGLGVALGQADIACWFFLIPVSTTVHLANSTPPSGSTKLSDLLVAPFCHSPGRRFPMFTQSAVKPPVSPAGPSLTMCHLVFSIQVSSALTQP